MSVNVKMQGESHELVEQNQLKWVELWSGSSRGDLFNFDLNDYPQNYAFIELCGEVATCMIPTIKFGSEIQGCGASNNGFVIGACTLTKDSKNICGKFKKYDTDSKSYININLTNIYGIKLGGVINRLLSLIQRRGC